MKKLFATAAAGTLIAGVTTLGAFTAAHAATDATIEQTACTYAYFTVEDPTDGMKVRVTINSVGSSKVIEPNAAEQGRLESGASMSLALPTDWVSVSVTVDGEFMESSRLARNLSTCPIGEEGEREDEEDSTDDKAEAPGGSNADPVTNAKVCSDFTYQEQAQSYYRTQVNAKISDSKLDGDGDGKACEELPSLGSGKAASGASAKEGNKVVVNSGEATDQTDWTLVSAGLLAMGLGGVVSTSAFDRKSKVNA